VREGGVDGLPGVRALGLELAARGGVAQVSCNVEDHRAAPLARVLEAVERHAPVAEAELVGLAPSVAFDGWPERVPVRNHATVEDDLRASAGRDAPRSAAGEAGGGGRRDAARPARDAGWEAPRRYP
jgi:hypothetical protein